MKKKVCIVGSNGYIGGNIFNLIKKSQNFKVFRFSNMKGEFIDKCEEVIFDYLIIASGIHTPELNNNPSILIENKKLIKIIIPLLNRSSNLILVSSFKTSINSNSSQIIEENKYNFYSSDSYYGKTKIINEKFFVNYCKMYNKSYLIISPSHVIGPNDKYGSINNMFLLNLYRSKVIFYPQCYISLVDVRHIANFVLESILGNELKNKKIILNDASISIKEYINLIKKKKFFFSFPVSTNLIKMIIFLQKILRVIFRYQFNLISDSRYKYILLNPKTVVNNYKRVYDLKTTIQDTKKLNI